RDYYDAINRREYERAYRLWAGQGEASKQTLEGFRRGFATTASVRLTVETAGRIGAAAGSRYVGVPVALAARSTRGETRHYRGTYTLRRSVVDGATREQRAWRIYSATLAPTD